MTMPFFIATPGVIMSYGINSTRTALALKSGHPYFDWVKIAIAAVLFFELSGMSAVLSSIRGQYGKDLFARQVFKCFIILKLVVLSGGVDESQASIPQEGFGM